MLEEVEWEELTEEEIRSLVFPYGALVNDPVEPSRKTISWGRPTRYLKPVSGGYSTEILSDFEASFEKERLVPKYKAFCLTPEGKCLVRISTQPHVKRTLATASEFHREIVYRHLGASFKLAGSMKKVPVPVDFYCIYALRKTKPVEPTTLLTQLFEEGS